MIGSKGFASGNTRSITFLSALSADELENFSNITMLREFSENTLDPRNEAIEKAIWGEAYKCIYAINTIIEGLPKSDNVSYVTKEQLLGEAYFLRAFCYFYLVNLFGDVPYLTETDYWKNIDAPRSPRKDIYQGIISDLSNAKSKLTDDYATGERIRPNKQASIALLARVYLFTGNWIAAEAMADSVISKKSVYFLEDSLDNVFVATSREAIWQLKPNISGVNTWEGRNFILNTAPSVGESNSSALRSDLLNVFENGDLRRSRWIDSILFGGIHVFYFPYKYKVKSNNELKEYCVILRLAEQYLIRAEARLQQGNLVGARSDINIIRKRAGLPETAVSTVEGLLNEILHERQVELFTEWGHRWLDLKRLKQSEKVLGKSKRGFWDATDTLYPIPLNQILLNNNLTQNQGYH
jgi:hypothetical protein